MFRIEIVPPEASVPAVPSGPKLCRYAVPSSSETMPTTVKTPRPVPFARSIPKDGVSFR